MDIVERLRESKLIRLTTGGGGEEVELPLHIEAADEIERLREHIELLGEEIYLLNSNQPGGDKPSENS